VTQPLELWELLARESVRHTLTSYHFAGDRGRLADLTACFHLDGTLEVVGSEPMHGRDAIGDGLGRLLTARRRPAATEAADDSDGTAAPDRPGYIRHHLASPHFRSVTPTEIHTSSYFAVMTDIGLDHWGRYADVLAPDDETGRWLIQRRVVTVDGHAPRSQFSG
jgi:hypothetical protein